MTHDPLISMALLGSARVGELPAAPDPALDGVWDSIGMENPSVGILQALALTRAWQRAGVKSTEVGDGEGSCPPESREFLPGTVVEGARRLMSGEFPEVLPEWLGMAGLSGKILPARVLPEMLAAATRDASMRPAIATLAGERGVWMARRHAKYSWLLGESDVPDDAWDGDDGPLRLAWYRQTRERDPVRAAEAIAAQWAGEDASMRENLVRIIAKDPQPADEEWLEKTALADRRQETRELAALALAGIPDSAFRKRAWKRLRECVTIVGSTIQVDPPNQFETEWAADGIRSKPAQGTGDKAWWLRQIVALVPLDEYHKVFVSNEIGGIFGMTIEGDWREAIILGWIDSARRMPRSAGGAPALAFFANLEIWPTSAPARSRVLAGILETLSPDARFDWLDPIAPDLPAPLMLELFIRAGVPPNGRGDRLLRILKQEVGKIPTTLFSRTEARALAACVPPSRIQPFLEFLGGLPEITTFAEAFATTLEFRRLLHSQFQSS